MYLKRMKIIFLGVFYHSILFRCIECSSEGLYFAKMSFQELKISQLIRRMKVYDEFQCLLSCKRLEECFSVNIADQPNEDGLYECVLLRSRMSESSGVLKKSLVYHHYSRLVDTCTSAGCMNNSPCQPLLNDFRCHCPQGFTGKRCERKYKRWQKINASPVCFGARNSTYGPFYIKNNGSFSTVKLVHLSGYVTCNYHHHSARSNWGCNGYTSGDNKSFPDRMFTVVTDDQNRKILPQDEFIDNFNTLEYNLPGGYTPQSPELIFPNVTTSMNVTAGQEYRIWYGQDLKDIYEDKNDGTSCVDVYMYGWFVE